MRTLSRLCVTPVKGMALLHPDEARLDATGLSGDRRLFLVDERGAVFSGSKDGRLVRIRPRYDAETEQLTLTFPDGEIVDGSVGGSTLGEAMIVDFYGRSVTATVVAGPWHEALSAFVGKPVRLLRCDRPGEGTDVHPLTLVSQASVRDLAARGRHEGVLDSRRFRINLELEGCDPYEEDGWDGRRVRIGEAVIRLRGQIPRCVVTTQDPATGSKDWDTLRQIARFRPRISGDGGLPFGMYAEGVEPGRIRLRDAVEPLKTVGR